jgi:hypothetical protein
MFGKSGAGEGIRTLDPNLGKLDTTLSYGFFFYAIALLFLFLLTLT